MRGATAWLLALATSAVVAGWLESTEQEGERLFRDGHYAEAAKVFRDPYRRGVAQYRAGEYAEAARSFESSIRPDNLELLADPELLEQVLINLVLNAADAVRGREGARVELAAYLDERGRPVLQVRDNGVGIPEENIDKVFIPFFSTKEGGSGIGLSLSRQVMQLHNGAITVSSRPGAGSTFTLRFRM